MEPWKKLVEVLAEIWVEQDIKSGKFADIAETQTKNSKNPEEENLPITSNSD